MFVIGRAGANDLHRTNLLDACQLFLNTKFIKILSKQVSAITAFT